MEVSAHVGLNQTCFNKLILFLQILVPTNLKAKVTGFHPHILTIIAFISGRINLTTKVNPTTLNQGAA